MGLCGLYYFSYFPSYYIMEFNIAGFSEFSFLIFLQSLMVPLSGISSRKLKSRAMNGTYFSSRPFVLSVRVVFKERSLKSTSEGSSIRFVHGSPFLLIIYYF